MIFHCLKKFVPNSRKIEPIFDEKLKNSIQGDPKSQVAHGIHKIHIIHKEKYIICMIPLRRIEIDISSNMCFIFFVLSKDWRMKEQNVKEKQTCCVYSFK